MHRHFLPLVLLFLLAATACQSSIVNNIPSGGVLFQDDFSSTSGGWMSGVDEKGNIAEFKEGKFRLYVAGAVETYLSVPHLRFTDVMIDVDAQKVAGPDDNDFGIICRYQDENNFYFLEISSDGYYGIGKYKNDQLMLISNTKMQSSDFIHQGQATNHLRAVCNGQTLSFSVNGQKLAEVQDSDFTAGDVGLIAGTFKTPGTDIYFDNFSVLKP